MDKNSLTSGLSDLTKQYDDLNNKIDAINKKISARKSIQASLGLFGLLLFLFSFALFAVIVLTLVLGKFDLYSELFLIVISILAVVWVIFFVVSRINIKSFSSNSIHVNKLSKQLKETKSKIDKTKLLIEKEEQHQKQQKTTEDVPEIQEQVEIKNQTAKSYKFVGREGDLKWGTEKEVAEWQKEKELAFEEEQNKKGLVKFVPVSLQIKELMNEEGHEAAFMSKFPEKWKSDDVPLDVTWGTPEQVFEWKQKEKGLIKFVDSDGKMRWGTEEQVAKWQQEKNAEA